MKQLILLLLTLLPAMASAQTSTPINLSVSIPVSVSLPTWTVPVNQPVTVNGISCQLTGTLTLTPITTTGTPVTTIGQIVTSTGAIVTTAASGTALILNGANLGTGGALTIAGLAAAVSSWTPTAIAFTVPKPASGSVSGPVVVTPAGGAAVTSSFTFAITQASVDTGDPQPWLFFSGYRPIDDGDTATQIKAGHRVMILGHHFGNQNDNCRVEINNEKATIVSWLDTAIVAQVPSLSVDAVHPAIVLVWRGPDQYCASMASFTVQPA